MSKSVSRGAEEIYRNVPAEEIPWNNEQPPELLEELIESWKVKPLDTARGRPYDASLLGYGLCSNGIVGLHAGIPIVVPRGHDCITLLLGSKEKYKQYFESHRGVYWFSPGWIETDTQPGKERFEKTLKEYIEKFGEDKAKYLAEEERSWLNEYEWATYIDWGFANSQAEKEFTKRAAEYLGWKYDEVKGDSGLLQRLVDGIGDEKEFLIVQPGQKVAEDLTDEGIIKAE